MEGAKRKIHRLRNSLSRRLSTSDDLPKSPNTAASNDTPAHPSAISPTKPLSASTTMTQATTNPKSGGVSKALPKAFTAKKARIIEDLGKEGYSDKSLKGSVDEGVKEVIALLNGVEGWVSTSSCGGRVSVFVEGPKRLDEVVANGEGEDREEEVAVVDGEETEVEDDQHDHEVGKGKVKTGIGGKGGGRWLYVSHDLLPLPAEHEAQPYMKLFGLEPASSTSFPHSLPGKAPRLIHLSFSPLILHILSATLPHAKPLLSAAINAGFRESGVQSLKALEDEDAGAMVGIRTAGLVFDSVIGIVVEDENGTEIMQSIVSEDYLKMCVGVINERFEGNEKRKARLLGELRKAKDELEAAGAEDKEERRKRNKEEGLRKQQESKADTNGVNEKAVVDDDELEDGLRGLEDR